MKAESLLVMFLFIVIMGLSVSCGVMRWNECRRVHPIWYCLGEK